MRRLDEQLVWKALCALDEVAEAARTGPVACGLAVRFALAYLYAASGASDRACFDDFWTIVRDPFASAYSPSSANDQRGSQATSALHGISRAVGIERSPEICAAMAAAHRRPCGPVSPGSSARR